MNGELHVLFGAGQVGSRLAELLLKAEKRVRVVKRSAGDVPPGVELLLGDAADPAFCTQAAAGGSTVYHCMNPPYYARLWASLVPRYMDNLIAAAARAKARLVVLDNVYMLGRPAGRILDEETPTNPCSRKGEIRARAVERMFEAHHRGEVSVERMFEAHHRGEVRATTGRASDFYGPGGTLTHLGDQFWRQALKKKTARVLVNPDMVHTYHYIPDVAAGLAVLGTAPDDAYGKPWMLPCTPAETMRDLVGRFSQALGREIRVTALPRWLVTTLGVFVPLLCEIGEMQYQWDEPFVVSDRRFRERFGIQPEAPDVAASATVTWAKQHYT